jgi:hypothetical protein
MSKVRVDKIKFKEPNAVRCLCGILFANQSSLNDHTPGCSVYNERTIRTNRWNGEELPCHQ